MLAAFDRRTKDFWRDIDGAGFREVRAIIEGSHTAVGGVLCGLAVEMDLRSERHPTRKGSPGKRLELAKSEMPPSLAAIRELERSARAHG